MSENAAAVKRGMLFSLNTGSKSPNSQQTFQAIKIRSGVHESNLDHRLWRGSVMAGYIEGLELG